MRHKLLLLLLLLPWQTFALGIEEPLPDAAQEARAKALFHEFRCVVCQSESVADSPAQVAADVRRTVREQVSAGKGDDEIKRYLVSRYGDFILMRPPFTGYTLLLWAGPALFLLAGGWLMLRLFRPKASGA